MRRTLLSLLTVAVLVPVAPAVAQNPIDDYRRNGAIDPCKYTDGQLKRGIGNLPPDVEQYAPGLADQLNQGRGGCGGAAPGGTETRQGEVVPGLPSGGNGGSGASGGGGAKAQIKAPPAPVAADRIRLGDLSTPAVSSRPGQGVPGWVLPLLLLALVAAAVVAAVRVTGADTSRLTRPLAAAFRDAGERSGDAVTGLWDRVRLGR